MSGAAAAADDGLRDDRVHPYPDGGAPRGGWECGAVSEAAEAHLIGRGGRDRGNSWTMAGLADNTYMDVFFFFFRGNHRTMVDWLTYHINSLCPLLGLFGRCVLLENV